MGSVVFDEATKAAIEKADQKPSFTIPKTLTFEIATNGLDDLNLDEVAAVMACILCQKISSPVRLMVCELGHILCENCYRSNPVKSCPTEKVGKAWNNLCRHPTSRFKCPLYIYFYENSVMKCKYWSIGCQINKLGKEVSGHEEVCSYRPSVPCIIPTCKDILVSPIGYGKHFKETHKVTSIDSNHHRIQLPCGLLEVGKSRMSIMIDNPARWASGVLNCFGLSFIVVVEENGPVLHIWAVVTDLGPQGRKFKSRFSIVCERFEKSWTGYVRPFGKNYQVTLAQEETFIIGKSLLQQHFVYKAGGLAFWNLDVHITEEVVPKSRVIPTAIESIASTSEPGDETKPMPKPRTIPPQQLYEKIFGKPEHRVILGT